MCVYREYYTCLTLMLGAVRVGLIDGDIVINPTRRQLAMSMLDLIVTGTTENKVGMYTSNVHHTG